MIGHLASEPAARVFSDYLYVKGIRNQIEAESDGRWSVWIHGEDEIEPARRLLQTFLVNPNDAGVQRDAARARDLLEQEEKNEAAVQKRQFDRDRLFPDRGGFMAAGPLTITLIALSVIVYILREYTAAKPWFDYLFIGDRFTFDRDLAEVRQGQVWRLITPIFLHFHILHILFNMLWMKDLGGMMEGRLGTRQLALLVVVIGVASNLAQYYMSGPNFGGMSGVVYGLLGYVWIRGKFDPGSGFFLHPTTVTMMLIWLGLGFANILPMMANTVHAVGLACGVIWGYMASRR